MEQTAFAVARQADGSFVISGPVDLAVEPQLTTALCAAPHHGPARIDMAHVSFIDTSGLRALIEADRVRGVRITAASTAVLRLLEWTGFASTMLDVDLRTAVQGHAPE